MIVVRNTFQVKFGRMKEAMPLMKENMARAVAAGSTPGRLMTDLTGSFYTIVLEFEFGSLTEMEQSMSQRMSVPGWQESYQKFCALVDSGHRELFSVVG